MFPVLLDRESIVKLERAPVELARSRTRLCRLPLCSLDQKHNACHFPRALCSYTAMELTFANAAWTIPGSDSWRPSSQKIRFDRILRCESSDGLVSQLSDHAICQTIVVWLQRSDERSTIRTRSAWVGDRLTTCT